MKYRSLLRLLLFGGWMVFVAGNVCAQTLTVPTPSGSNANFTLSNLPQRQPNLTVYHDYPFYQGFFITGGGNFLRIQNHIDWRTGGSFSHQYLDYTNKYPAALIIIDRKSGDDPPEAAQTALPGTLGTAPSGIVEISGTSALTDLVEINPIVPAPSPLQSPLITAPNEKIALTYSHYAVTEEESRFYLKDDRIGAFAIAYKPEAQGKIFFFYDSHDPTTSNFDHKKVQFQSPTNTFDAGTLIPDYSAVNTVDGLLGRMSNPLMAPNVAQTLFSGTPLNPMMLENVIPFDVTSEDPNAFANGQGDELRLFHLLKNVHLQNTDYQFVAVYYSDENMTDPAIYAQDQSRLSGIINLPSSFTFQGKPLHYVDAVIMEIKKGEPDDPNNLTIEEICKCNGDYRVKFKLKYCNNSTVAAPGANVMLDSYKAGRRMMDCIQLRGITPEGSKECCERRECVTSGECCFRTPSGLRFRDKKYCIRYDTGHELAAGKNDSCGTVEFTARIAERDLHMLKERSVMRYCVNLHGHTDEQFICDWNEILRDSTFDDEAQVWVKNPIWENRTQKCST